MHRTIKKYFPVLSAIILLGFAFLPGLFSSAQGPAFEIYGNLGGCNNVNKYPLVTDTQVVVSDNFVTITAHVCDVSGVALVLANIEDPNAGLYGEPSSVNFAMSNDGSGTGTWQVVIDTTNNSRINWDENSLYYINIAVTDALFNTNINRSTGEFDAYHHVGYFSMSGALPTSITDFTTSLSSVSTGSTITLSATLLDMSSSPIPGKEIIFRDITDSADIDSVTTDANGEGQVTYQIPTDATPGVHTLRAIFDGEALLLLPSDSDITIDISTDEDNPVVTITSPTNGTSYESTSVNFNASATDDSLGFLAPNLDSSLVSWWRMDDVDGSGNPTDYIGNNDGTKYGDAHQISGGKFGKGFSFDGDGDYVQTGPVNLGDGWGEITTSAWIYVNGWINYSGIIAARNLSTGDFTGLDLRDSGSQTLSMYADTGSVSGYARSSAIQAGQWYHVVGTWKSGEAPKIFVNGQDVTDTGTSVAATGTIYQKDYFEIGWDKSTSGGYRYFNGSVDEVMIFNRVLSSGEIKALYDATAINQSLTLSNGSHDYKVYASDASGNIGFAGSNTFTSSTTVFNGCTNLLTVDQISLCVSDYPIFSVATDTCHGVDNISICVGGLTLSTQAP